MTLYKNQSVIDGSDLPAGALIVGQPYIIRRTAGQYRVVRGDVTSVEVATIRSELAPVQSTIIASSSPSQRDIRGILRPNTFIAITDAVITGSPFSAFNPVSGSLSVLPISGGVKHEWREPNGRIWTNYHQNGAWTGWALQLNKAAVDRSISAQSLRIGKVEQFKSILEAISATDTIVVGQIADMSGLSSTSSSGAAVMVLTGTAFLNGGMLRRVQFFSTAGAARVAAVTTWSADGEGRRLYASQDVTVQRGFNDIAVSLPIPAGGTVGITSMAASIGINSSSPGVPIVFSDDVTAGILMDRRPRRVSVSCFLLMWSENSLAFRPVVVAAADQPRP